MKLKRELVQTCLWCAVLLPGVVQAQFNYVTNNGAITITGYTGSGGAVAIPDTIDGWPVVSIGNSAFAHSTSLTGVTIPDSVTNIANQAFYACTGLTSFSIGGGVFYIGQDAFFAWQGTNVDVPANVAYIGHRAFAGPKLQAITVDPLNPSYYSTDGVLFSRNPSGLVQYPVTRAGSYTIPNGVSNIWTFAFYACSKLTTVTIPPSVTYIGTDSFQYCTNLGDVHFEGDAPYVAAHGATVFDHDDNVTIYILSGAGGWAYPPTFFRPLWPWLPKMEVASDTTGAQTNQFGFNITWADGKVMTVDACTDLAHPVWTPIGTVTLAGGAAYFSDPDSTNYTSRFYRVHSP